LRRAEGYREAGYRETEGYKEIGKRVTKARDGLHGEPGALVAL